MDNNYVYRLSDTEVAQELWAEISPSKDPKQLMKLMLECEAYIGNIKGFRNKLDKTSFWRFITRIHTKKQLNNAQLDYLEIAHQMQRQIVNHIDDMECKMTLLMKKVIKLGIKVREFEEIRDKISELDNRVSILEWLGSIPYSKTKEGILYKELPVSAKVFVIVHDLFQMKSQKPTDTQLHQAWDNIGLPDSIRLVDFLADFSQNTQYADLLSFYNYDYDYPYLSRFGKCLAKIVKMTEDSEKQECIRTCYRNVSSVDTIGLYFCDELLTDMMRLREQYQARYAIETDNSDVDEVIKEVFPKDDRPDDKYPNPTILLVLNKESGKSFVYQNKAWKKVYSTDEDSLCYEYHPDIVVIPDRFDKAKFPSNVCGINNVLRLNDFAAHLWFRSRIRNGTFREVEYLCVFDFDYKRDGKEKNGQQYVRVYQNNEYKNKYCRMHDGRTQKHMLEDLNHLCGYKPRCSFYHAFRTFSCAINDGTIERLQGNDNIKKDMRADYELEKYLPVLCGANADEELKLLLEHFNISLDANKSSVVSNSVFW